MEAKKEDMTKMAEAKKEEYMTKIETYMTSFKESYLRRVKQLREWMSKPYGQLFIWVSFVFLLFIFVILGVRIWSYSLFPNSKELNIDVLIKNSIEKQLWINILIMIGCLLSSSLLLIRVTLYHPRCYHLPLYPILPLFMLAVPKWYAIQTAIPDISYPIFITCCLGLVFSVETFVIIMNYYTSHSTKVLSSGEHGFCIRTQDAEMVKTGWDSYIETIFQLVGEKHLRDESFAIGIAGKWGSGKTTFYDAVKKKVKNDGTFLLCEFKPWQILESERIAPEFFAEFSKTISNENDEEDKKFRKSILKYVHALTEVPKISDFAKAVDAHLNSYHEATIQELRERINKQLDNKNVHVAVLVDDLDRLNEKELLEIMQLVRASANFKHVLFILTYDKGYFKSLLNNENGLEYLKKIVNVEISLPPVEQYKYGQLLLQSIENICNIAYDTTAQNRQVKRLLSCLEKFVMDENTLAEESVLYEHLHNFRDIKRFSNQFGLALRHLIKLDEIDHFNIKELFWLEVLHYVDENTYNDLRNNHKTLLEFKTSRSIKQRTLTIKKDVDISKKKSHSILKKLFVTSEEYKHTTSIVWINNYYSYFTYRQVEDYISATEFAALMQEPNPNKIVNKIKHLLKISYNKSNIEQILKDYPQRGRFDNETAANNYIFLLLNLLYMTKPYIMEDFVIGLIKEKFRSKHFSKIANYNPKDIIRLQIEGHPDPIWNRLLVAMCAPIDTSIVEMDADYIRRIDDTAYVLPIDQLKDLAILNYTQSFKSKKLTAWELFNKENEQMRFISGLSYPSEINGKTNVIGAYGNLIGQYILEQQIKGYRKKKFRKETFDSICQNLIAYSKAREQNDEESAQQAIALTIEQIIGSLTAFETFITNYFELDESSLIMCRNIGLNIQQEELDEPKNSAKHEKRAKGRKYIIIKH